MNLLPQPPHFFKSEGQGVIGSAATFVKLGNLPNRMCGGNKQREY
jgi:hypothetical protein